MWKQSNSKVPKQSEKLNMINIISVPVKMDFIMRGTDTNLETIITLCAFLRGIINSHDR